MSVAVDVRRAERAAAADRLREKVRESLLGKIDAVVDVLDSQGSKAALLEGSNRYSFKVLHRSTSDGAVMANLREAAATEDQQGLPSAGGPLEWRHGLQAKTNLYEYFV